MSSVDPAPDPNLAAAIARAELGRAMFERLAVIGMAMAEEIGERHVHSPYHPEPKHEPGRAFACVSRAVRLTVVLMLRVDADIIAMRKGTFAPVAAKPASGSSVSAPILGSVFEDSPCAIRAKVRDAVCEAINREVGDVETADIARERVRESLIEREDYGEFLGRPWRQCVEAICADLGLNPDWSDWSDDTGFPKVEAGPGYDGPRAWSSDPAAAENGSRQPGHPPPFTAEPPGVYAFECSAFAPLTTPAKSVRRCPESPRRSG